MAVVGVVQGLSPVLCLTRLFDGVFKACGFLPCSVAMGRIAKISERGKNCSTDAPSDLEGLREM